MDDLSPHPDNLTLEHHPHIARIEHVRNCDSRVFSRNAVVINNPVRRSHVPLGMMLPRSSSSRTHPQVHISLHEELMIATLHSIDRVGEPEIESSQELYADVVSNSGRNSVEKKLPQR